MATLAAVNDTLLEVSNNTKETSKGISAFVKFIEIQKGKDLEAEREAKANQAKLDKAENQVNRSAKSSKGGGFFSGLTPGKAGLIGAAAALGPNIAAGLIKRIPAVALIGFADQIADTLLGPNFEQDTKDSLARGLQGGGLGALLGKRFILPFAALGALATDENKKMLGDIGKNLKTNWNESAKALAPFLGFLPSFDNILKFIGTSTTDGLKAIKGFTESGFNSEEFKSNWIAGVGLLGTAAALLMPGKFAKGIKFLAKFAGSKKGLVLAALAGGTFVYDKFFNEDGSAIESGAAVLGTAALGYGGFKAIQGYRNRGVPTADDMDAREKQFKNKPVQIIKKGGKEFVKSNKGDLYKRGSPQANMIESKGGTQGVKMPAKFERFAKFMKFPGIAALLSAYDVYGILNSDGSLKEKTEKMSGVFGGLLGSGGGAVLGGAIGSVFPGPGTLLGGFLGGTGGYFAGDYLGSKLAEFLLSGVKDDFSGFKANKGMSPGQMQSMTGNQVGTNTVKAPKSDYNQKLKNNMYNMSGIGDAGATSISAGNKVNSDNNSSTTSTSVSNTSVSSRGGILDLQDQFGFGT